MDSQPSAEAWANCVASWGKVTALDPTYETQGVILFKNIFALAPDAVNMFSFKDEANMYESPKLKKHGANVMKHVNLVMMDFDCFKMSVVDLGKRHVEYGLTLAHYEVVEQAIYKTLKTALGADWEPVKAAWEWQVKRVLTTMKGDNFKNQPAQEQAASTVDTIQEYTMEEVKAHNTKDSCWLVMEGNVYDVTKFLDDHPGGANLILDETGKDATEAFDDAEHSKKAQNKRKEFLIGKLKQ